MNLNPTRIHQLRHGGAFDKTITIAWLLILLVGISWPGMLWSLVLLGPVMALGLYDMYQTRHALCRSTTCCSVIPDLPR